MSAGLGGEPPNLGEPSIGICDLAERPLWVAWQSEMVTPKGGGTPRVTKIPYSARGSGKASSTRSSTWGTLGEAFDRSSRLAYPVGNIGGLGMCASSRTTRSMRMSC